MDALDFEPCRFADLIDGHARRTSQLLHTPPRPATRITASSAGLMPSASSARIVREKEVRLRVS